MGRTFGGLLSFLILSWPRSADKNMGSSLPVGSGRAYNSHAGPSGAYPVREVRGSLAPSESTARLRTIVVPTDGSHASMQAVALACEIARKNKGRVLVVHVVEVKRTLALDAQLEKEESAGDEMLSRAEQVARKDGFQVEGEILHAREAGPAIVDEAIERSADLIVLGMAYKQPGQFQLGHVVHYVLKNAPCEVWVCRHPVE